MPQSIPSILSPYLQTAATSNPLHLVTSTSTTPAHWLLLRWIRAVLADDSEAGAAIHTGQHASKSQPQIILISLLRSQDLWIELARKVGLDLPGLIKTKQLVYIDGLTSQSGKGSGPLPVSVLPNLSLQELSKVIRKALQDLTTVDSIHLERQPTIIIDGLDFLLAAAPDVDAVSVQQFLSQTQIAARSLVVSCSADSSLLHNHSETSTPLEREHSASATTMAHQACWVFQLRGLDTGAAKDVTGVLRISHGGGQESTEFQIPEGEWLYQTKGDGSVRMWSRGE